MRAFERPKNVIRTLFEIENDFKFIIDCTYKYKVFSAVLYYFIMYADKAMLVAEKKDYLLIIIITIIIIIMFYIK